MRILDGRQLAKDIKLEIAADVVDLKEKKGITPHLAAVLVGDNPASQSYVRSKVTSCEQVGFKSTLIKKDNDITQEELLEVIHSLNNDADIDGFIVQLPLPKGIDEDVITMAIDPDKDVDGFHPINLGKMMIGLPCFLPATPYGILQLLDRNGIEIEGSHVVVLGRSNIVGTPISILLSRKNKYGNATVTLAHSRTKNINDITRQADILIVALGISNHVKADMVKDGVTIVDVGINRVDDSSRDRGYRLTGDVDFDDIKDKCLAITPVPGGVGPMTVTSLLLNTLQAAKKKG